MTSPRKWRAVVEFYSDTPDDDLAADDHADKLTDVLQEALNAAPLIDGWVRVADLDTVSE